MIGPWPLALDVGNMVGLLVFLLFMIISVVGSLANKWREMQEEAARRARQQRPRPVPPRPQGQGQSPLDDEIADFLRTAGQRRGEAGQRRPDEPPRRPAAIPPRPPETPVEVVAVETPPVSLAETLAARELASGALGQLAGEQPAEEWRETRFQDTFTHSLGALRETEAKPAPAFPAPDALPIPATAPAGLAAMLASGDSLRNAVILSEILNRKY